MLVLFDSLRSPVVVFDVNYHIKFANRACCELLSREAMDIQDTNFFPLSVNPDQRSQSIERYLHLFDKESLTVTVRSGSSVSKM